MGKQRCWTILKKLIQDVSSLNNQNNGQISFHRHSTGTTPVLKVQAIAHPSKFSIEDLLPLWLALFQVIQRWMQLLRISWPGVKHYINSSIICKVPGIIQPIQATHTWRNPLEGDWVYLKIRPHKQVSLPARLNPKLFAKYYDPYLVLKQIGAVAFKLQLPSGARIHLVFHISRCHCRFTCLISSVWGWLVNLLEFWILDKSYSKIHLSHKRWYSGKANQQRMPLGKIG